MLSYHRWLEEMGGAVCWARPGRRSDVSPREPGVWCGFPAISCGNDGILGFPDMGKVPEMPKIHGLQYTSRMETLIQMDDLGVPPF